MTDTPSDYPERRRFDAGAYDPPVLINRGRSMIVNVAFHKPTSPNISEIRGTTLSRVERLGIPTTHGTIVIRDSEESLDVVIETEQGSEAVWSLAK